MGVIPEGYLIHDLTAADAPALAAAYRRNREHLEPWEPAREESYFTDDGQAAAVAGQLSTVTSGLGAAWVLTHGEKVVGRVNLNNIVRGVLCSASVGYWVDADHQGRGLASAAVEHACARASRHTAAQQGLATSPRTSRLRLLRDRGPVPVHPRTVAGAPALPADPARRAALTSQRHSRHPEARVAGEGQALRHTSDQT